MTDTLSHSRDDNPREWFESWFDHPLYLQVYHHRDEAEASRCAAAILRLTGLEPAIDTLSLLDVACGAGRHALAFARMGLDVTANDLSPFLLNRAKELAVKAGLSMEFSLQDMRSIGFDRHFGLIVQLFSSFGYFESDSEDRAVIAHVAKLLRPEGWYVLDLLNPDHLRRNFVERTERSAGALSITEERTLTERHVAKRLTLHEEDGRELSFTESVRLYSADEIVGLLASEGFLVEQIIGDYNGTAFDPAVSPRMMLLSRLSPLRA